MAQKLRTAQLIAAAAFAMFVVGSASAQPAAPAPNPDMAEVQKVLAKAGVKDADKITMLPPQAVAMFKAIAQGKNSQEIEKAMADAAKTAAPPSGGGR